MEIMKEKTKPKIGETVFLYNPEIALPKDVKVRSFLPEEIVGVRISFPFAGEMDEQPSTEILEQRFCSLGYGDLSSSTKYSLSANAIQYIAEVKLPKSKPQIIRLYHGGIQIYGFGDQSGSIYTLFRSGNIYQTDQHSSSTFNTFVFGNATTKAGKERRIEAILRGYELQEVKERNEISRASLQNYQRGQMDAREADHGTFARW